MWTFLIVAYMRCPYSGALQAEVVDPIECVQKGELISYGK